MNLTDDQIIEKYAKKYMHCLKNSILPIDYEWTFIASGYSVMKGKNDLTKKQHNK